jgi:spoIIIJ-associated protein
VTERQRSLQRPGRKGASLAEIESFFLTLVEHSQLDLDAGVREEEGVIHINLTGPDRTYLLAGGAALLNSTEYLLNRIFPGAGTEAPGIILDSDDYRKHREIELRLLARMASEKVVASRKPLTLQPMTPRERRIVHLALAETPGVRSESQGDGDNRSVTLYPA